VYDGDALRDRVKGTVNGVTTVYASTSLRAGVGNYYELGGSTTRVYYYAGSQRVAMRENGTLYYLLGDHLGSTPTSHRFTSQQEQASLGCMIMARDSSNCITGLFCF
jgi:hypothetical protein